MELNTIMAAGMYMTREKYARDIFVELANTEYTPMTRECEIELMKKYRETRDLEALQTLVLKNMRFLVEYAYKNGRSSDVFGELVNACVVGLITAIHRYNPSSGCKLLTYAKYYLMKEIQECQRHEATIVLTSYMAFNVHKIRHCVSSAIENGRISDGDLIKADKDKPSYSPVRNTMVSLKTVRSEMSTTKPEDVNVAKLQKSKRAVKAACRARKTQHVCKNGNDFGNLSRKDFDPCIEIANDDESSVIREAVNKLDPDESMVIKMKYIDQQTSSMSLREIGRALNMSHENVRLLVQTGLSKLRVLLNGFAVVV